MRDDINECNMKVSVFVAAMNYNFYANKCNR
jgi:hypothetical protein